MKVIEILNLNKELLKNFRQAGIRIEDVEYIELYKEYQKPIQQWRKDNIYSKRSRRQIRHKRTHSL